MGKATGKANHPHNAARPERASLRRALEEGDIEDVRSKLSPRQRRFAEEYVIDFNGSAAAIRAGYSPTYSDRQAHLLLKHKGVAAVIDDLSRSKEAKITSVTPDYIIQRITQIVNNAEAKDGDKLRGLELLARHLGMLTDKTEIKGEIDLNDKRKVNEEADKFTNLMKQLRERAEKKDVFIV